MPRLVDCGNWSFEIDGRPITELQIGYCNAKTSEMLCPTNIFVVFDSCLYGGCRAEIFDKTGGIYVEQIQRSITAPYPLSNVT